MASVWGRAAVRLGHEPARALEDHRRRAAEAAGGAAPDRSPGAAAAARPGVTAAPDLVQPVVAFRAWRVVDEDLLSPYIPCRWDGPVMHAECYPANRALLFGRGWLAEPHDPPHPECRCGI